jgi:hypothetical protein
MRRLRACVADEILLAQVVPGFLMCVGWAVMYEIYHEDGSYYTTLLQEILGGEDLFLYFLVSALLMALPIGLVIDTVREVLVERWLGVPRPQTPRTPKPSSLQAILQPVLNVSRIEDRYLLYRHARAALLTPAKAAGNLALTLLIFLVWFVVKIIRMQGWHIFSVTFIIGTPVVGLAIFGTLCARYVAGLAEFQALATVVIAPPQQLAVPQPLGETPAPPSAVRSNDRLHGEAQ